MKGPFLRSLRSTSIVLLTIWLLWNRNIAPCYCTAMTVLDLYGLSNPEPSPMKAGRFMYYLGRIFIRWTCRELISTTKACPRDQKRNHAAGQGPTHAFRGRQGRSGFIGSSVQAARNRLCANSTEYD